jgi:hypothetical protein
MLGEEDMGVDVLEYIYKHTHRHNKLLLMEFLGKVPPSLIYLELDLGRWEHDVAFGEFSRNGSVGSAVT